MHYITEHDIEILRLLKRYRYLRSSFIYALLPHRQPRAIRVNLKKLRSHHYVALPAGQFRGYNSLACPYIYELTPKGETLLTTRVPEVTNLLRVKSDAPTKQFAHSMMICDALASIEIGVKAAGLAFIGIEDILARAPGTMKLPCALRYTFPSGQTVRKDTKLIPDGLFGIRYENGEVAFFALEAEHYNPITASNLDRASFMKKVIAYRDINRRRTYREQLSIPSFRVLFVFPNEQRVRSARAFVETYMERSRLYLLTDIPVQEELMDTLDGRPRVIAPPPFPELFARPWERAGLEPLAIHQPSP